MIYGVLHAMSGLKNKKNVIPSQTIATKVPWHFLKILNSGKIQTDRLCNTPKQIDQFSSLLRNTTSLIPNKMHLAHTHQRKQFRVPSTVNPIEVSTRFYIFTLKKPGPKRVTCKTFHT